MRGAGHALREQQRLWAGGLAVGMPTSCWGANGPSPGTVSLGGTPLCPPSHTKE